MQKKLYVGNLSYDTAEGDLEKLFSQHGQVRQVDLIRDRHSGQSKGFAFVEMAEVEGAEKAVTEDGKEFMGRTIRVSEARPPRQEGQGGGRERRGGFGGGGRGGWNRR